MGFLFFSEGAIHMNIEIPQYLTEKDGLLYVRTYDEHYIHQSFLLRDEKVLVFESIPSNYPNNALCVFPNVEEYLASIKEVAWLNDHDYIVKQNLEAYGYPFTE